MIIKEVDAGHRDEAKMYLVSQGVALEACPHSLKDFDELTKLFLASSSRPTQDRNAFVSADVLLKIYQQFLGLVWGRSA